MTIIDELDFEYAGSEKKEVQERVLDATTASDNLRQLQSLYDSLTEDLDSLWSPTLLRDDEFSSRDFELLIGSLWDWKGYDTYVTPPTNDGGVDVITHDDNKGIFIEAKNTSLDTRVSVREVRNLHAAASNPEALDYEILGEVDTISKIIIITTSDLTQQATRFLKSVPNSTSFDVIVIKSEDIVYELNKSPLSPENWREYID